MSSWTVFSARRPGAAHVRMSGCPFEVVSFPLTSYSLAPCLSLESAPKHDLEMSTNGCAVVVFLSERFRQAGDIWVHLLVVSDTPAEMQSRLRAAGACLRGAWSDQLKHVGRRSDWSQLPPEIVLRGFHPG